MVWPRKPRSHKMWYERAATRRRLHVSEAAPANSGAAAPPAAPRPSSPAARTSALGTTSRRRTRRRWPAAGRAGGPERAVEAQHRQCGVGGGQRDVGQGSSQRVLQRAFDGDATAALQHVGGGEQQRALRQLLRTGAREGADQALGEFAPGRFVGQVIEPRRRLRPSGRRRWASRRR